MATHSPWHDLAIPAYPRLRENRAFDVVVIGGGLTGLSAAYFLKLAGKSVGLVERDRLGDADTGHTTAHLTYVTDLRLSELANRFDRESARLVWAGGAAAINTIEAIVSDESIDCGFQRIPAYLHASIRDDRRDKVDLKREYELAREFGFHATFLDSVPVFERPGIRFSNQAKVHPLKYLAGLAEAVDGDESCIFEQSEVAEVLAQPLGVRIGGLTVHCEHLVIATHVPLMGNTGMLSAALFQSKLAPYSTYAVRAQIPGDGLPAASYWDTSDPYYYLRVDPSVDRSAPTSTVIFGGEDHKTGQAANTQDRYRHLEEILGRFVPNAQIDRRWSGQIVETNDGLPYIGPTADRQYVATGFCGNGMTFGTLAGMMIADYVLERPNPWHDLYSINRPPLRGGIWDYLQENFDYPYYLIRDRLARAEARSPQDVKPGEGQVLSLDGQRVACWRDERGEAKVVSAVCTHMGCLVRWNDAEKTWDCPCHGSRFHADGRVFAGPAETPLPAVTRPHAHD